MHQTEEVCMSMIISTLFTRSFHILGAKPVWPTSFSPGLCWGTLIHCNHRATPLYHTTCV